jgi:hypothetical protein
MRLLIVAIFASCFAALGASAQQEPIQSSGAAAENESAFQETRFAPEWERRPTGRDFARNYPPGALDREIAGFALLCCTPRADRTLDCRAGLSWPREYAFDTASLAVARSFRMTQASYDAFQATPGAWMQIPIRWRHVSTGADYDALVERVSESARSLCRPQGG